MSPAPQCNTESNTEAYCSSKRTAGVALSERSAEFFERRAQIVHRLEALVLVDRHRLRDDFRQPGRQSRIDLARRARLALHVLVHDRHVIAAGVGRNARHDLVEDHAERVDVRALIHLLAEDLFRGHVLRRSDDIARFRQLRVAFALRGGDAEVHDLEQAFGVDEDVRGLEVAMHDSLGVRDVHAGADVDAEAERALQRHRFLADDLATQRVRREVLHRDGVVALDVEEVVDADDVVVRDLARVTQLVHEPLHDLFVFGDVRVQELEDEPFVDDRVLHQQHGAERALADAFDVFVAALDDVAGLESLDVELLRPGHLLGFFHGALHVLFGHELRALRGHRVRGGAGGGA